MKGPAPKRSLAYRKLLFAALAAAASVMLSGHAWAQAGSVGVSKPLVLLIALAALSMVPTKTGAAAAVALVIPELKNKFDGLAVRVPTPDVSLVDVVIEVERETTVPEVNKALAAAANRYLRYTEEPLVSIDFQGDPHSSIVDGLCTRVLGTSVKIMSWYDNEWGYSNRMLDLVLHMEAHKLI